MPDTGTPHLLRLGPALAPRRRAVARLVVLILLINPILTCAFAFVARGSHPDLALGLTTLFCFMTCAALSAWIRSDARHAWRDARASGFVEPRAIASGATVRVHGDCPRRWLVELHIGLQGGITARRQPEP
ncbi:conserved hypothetical protein [Paraburkholderia tropica]|nr:conserved hypothetical protein [Paraburkholderia tropica]